MNSGPSLILRRLQLPPSHHFCKQQSVLAAAQIAVFLRLAGHFDRRFVSDSRRPWLAFPCAFLDVMPKAGPANSIASDSAHAHLLARVAAAL
jgi:hypothetical protein